MEDGTKVMGQWPLIPARYSRPHSSGLTAEVQPGRDNRVTFELE